MKNDLLYSTTMLTVVGMGVSIASLLAAPVIAQTAPAKTAAVNEATKSGELETITVTAQKRKESAQSVPISIQSLSSEELLARGISSTNDLPLVVAGFQIASSAQNQLYYLRGVGSQQVGTSSSPAVSTFIDGVYMPFSSSLLQGFNNIASIEVDKGPQGTLFGRNSTGGVIQINTKDPTQQLSGDISAGYANYNHFTGSGYVASGITNGVAADIAVQYDNQAKGFGNNITTGKTVFKNRLFSARSKWLFNLSENTTLRLIGDYSDVLTDNGSIIRQAKGRPILFDLTNGGPLVYPGFYDTVVNTRSDAIIKGYGFSGKITTDLGFAELASITAYRRITTDTAVDFDGTAITFVPTGTKAREKALTEEIQLASPKGSAITWTVGGFFLRQVGVTNAFEFSPPFSSIVFGAPPGQSYFLNAKATTTSFAGFAQATAKIIDKTNLTLGVRFTQDKKTIDGFGSYGFGPPPGPFIVPGTSGSQSKTFSKPTFRIAVDHDFTNNVKVYASFNRGFQAGTFNSNSATGYSPQANPPLEPEKIDAYEIGLKSEWLDRRLRLNLAAYLYNYSNLQQQRYNNNVLVSANAGAARMKGIDFELKALPTRGLTFGISAAYLDAVYTDYNGAPGYAFAPNYALLQINVNATGNKVINAPTFTASLFANYALETSLGTFTTNASLLYNSGSYADASNIYKEPKYYVIAMSEELKLKENFSLSLYVKNLNNRQYDQSIIIAAPTGFIGNTPGAPREYGFSLRYKF